ncbi:DNA/RNA non-specific endonuclease [Enterococcus sp. DIV0421]|uniref:DNA/RNA non-specific endonuclease n=1 Tax=Enterococcus sp. DIV0421 TaxID=2774688 RepID=UPI003F68248D
MNQKRLSFWLLIFIVCLSGCSSFYVCKTMQSLLEEHPSQETVVREPQTLVDQKHPTFSSNDLSLANGAWQHFSSLDPLNRVGEANALLHRDMMPTEERERLFINPTGWKQKKMPNGDYLYNRCHLIGFQLTGENNNPKNLMTGTRSFNTPAMVDIENKVAEYLRNTGNHVRYRVTPDFQGEELVARGVRIEAQSIEDDEISFNVYIHNRQDGYTIDYRTGIVKKISRNH